MSQIIFILCFLVAAGIFAKKVGRIRRNIFLGKPEKIAGNVNQRIKNTLLIAFGQKKMFKRWLPATMHLTIYVAFIITQIELIEIFIDGFTGGHRLIWQSIESTALGGLYTFTISFIEILSLFALISTFIFLARRNLLKIPRFQKPEMNGWPKLDGNIILYFEILLVTCIFTMNGADLALQKLGAAHYHHTDTFALSQFVASAFSGLSEGTLIFLERAGWWGHILGVLVFLNYIPHSKHLHIFLAFPNTYYARLKQKGQLEHMPEVSKEVMPMFEEEEEVVVEAPVVAKPLADKTDKVEETIDDMFGDDGDESVADIFGDMGSESKESADDIFGDLGTEEKADENVADIFGDMGSESEESADDIFGDLGTEEKADENVADIFGDMGSESVESADDIFGDLGTEEKADENVADIFGDMGSESEESADDIFGDLGTEEKADENVADIFGDMGSESKESVDDIFGDSGSKEESVDDIFGGSDDKNESVDDIFGGGGNNENVDDIFGENDKQEENIDDLFGGGAKEQPKAKPAVAKTVAPPPPVEEEFVKFGASDVFDLSWKSMLDAYTCTECGRCTSECPANLTGKKLSPRKVMMDVRDRAEEIGRNLDAQNMDCVKESHKASAKKLTKENYDDGKNLFDYISEEELRACTTCNACVEACPVMINPVDIIMQLRRNLILDKAEAPEAWSVMFTNIENNAAPWQFSQSERDKWTELV